MMTSGSASSIRSRQRSSSSRSSSNDITSEGVGVGCDRGWQKGVGAGGELEWEWDMRRTLSSTIACHLLPTAATALPAHLNPSSSSSCRQAQAQALRTCAGDGRAGLERHNVAHGGRLLPKLGDQGRNLDHGVLLRLREVALRCGGGGWVGRGWWFVVMVLWSRGAGCT